MPDFVNLTPHAIVFQHPDGTRRTFAKPEKGMDARVDPLPVRPEEVSELEGMTLAPYPMYGPVVNLPEPQEGTIYIVSLIVLGRPEVASRKDLVAPGTGPKDGAIRFAE